MIAPSTVPSTKLPHVPSSCCSNRRRVPAIAGAACQAAACPALPCRPRALLLAGRQPCMQAAAVCRLLTEKNQEPPTQGGPLCSRPTQQRSQKSTACRASTALPTTARPNPGHASHARQQLQRSWEQGGALQHPAPGARPSATPPPRGNLSRRPCPCFCAAWRAARGRPTRAAHPPPRAPRATAPPCAPAPADAGLSLSPQRQRCAPWGSTRPAR